MGSAAKLPSAATRVDWADFIVWLGENLLRVLVALIFTIALTRLNAIWVGRHDLNSLPFDASWPLQAILGVAFEAATIFMLGVGEAGVPWFLGLAVLLPVSWYLPSTWPHFVRRLVIVVGAILLLGVTFLIYQEMALGRPPRNAPEASLFAYGFVFPAIAGLLIRQRERPSVPRE